MLIPLLLATHFVVVRDDAVKPPQLSEYRVAAKAVPQLTTFALSNLHYMTIADVDSLDAAAAIATQSIAPDALNARDVSIWRLRPDLSYEPAEPQLKREEENYVHFDVYACIPGHGAETEALTKEYAAVDRAAGVKHRWEIYEVVVGGDLPAFVLATPARSRADYESEKIAADALRHNRDLPLHARNTKLLRHISSFDGTIYIRAVQRSLTTN